MNTQLNDDFVNLAKELFEDLTQTATFKQTTGGGINFETGNFDGDVVTNIPIYCRISNPTVGDIDKGLATKEDAIILTAGIYFKSNKPLVGDKIVVGSKTYIIKNFIGVDAVYETALYKFVCGIA